jgi:hypothetical protein
LNGGPEDLYRNAVALPHTTPRRQTSNRWPVSPRLGNGGNSDLALIGRKNPRHSEEQRRSGALSSRPRSLTSAEMILRRRTLDQRLDRTVRVLRKVTGPHEVVRFEC